jgi:formamidopyrimidine-DNA glycosylase
MPELPEVETVCRGISPALEGATIAKIDIRQSKLRLPVPENLGAVITGQRVERVRRRAKYILIDFEDGHHGLVHLGMSGAFRVYKADDEKPPLEKHDHIIIDTDAGARLIYNDPRKFGFFDLIDPGKENDHNFLCKLGVEPMGNHLNANYLWVKFKGKKAPIKQALLDQSLIAGLGNIYVAEVLYLSGISPTKKSGTISKKRLETLCSAVREVIAAAIDAGGSSLKDFSNTEGELGYFQHEFKVYNQADKPCSKESCNGTIKRIVQSGRSTYYCPKCQS